MKRKQSREQGKSSQSPWRLLLWTALAGLIFGLIQFGEIAENYLRIARNSLHRQAASGDIVIVAIDDASLREFGTWPWPRARHAELVDRLTERGAKAIFFDIQFNFKSRPADDLALENALKRSGRVTLPAHVRTGNFVEEVQALYPLPALRRHTKIVTINFRYNYNNEVWKLPFALKSGDRTLPSMASKLAGVAGPAGEQFRIDYSLDPATVPLVSAGDLLTHRAPTSLIAGKTVIIGTTSQQLGDIYFVPGYGRMTGVYVHALAAETLKSGTPIDAGWVVAFLFSLASMAFAARQKIAARQNILFATTGAGLLAIPYFLETNLIFADVTPGLFVVSIVAFVTNWRRFRSGAVVNSVSGLPNLSALRVDRGGRARQLVAARIHNYAEIVSTLSPDSERQLVEQIVAKLSVGDPNRRLYHGDEGIFAWFADTGFPIGHHLDALSALFRSPAKLREGPLDLAISFGVEIGSSRSLANRLGSALVAADEAATQSLKWKYYDPAKLDEAAWKLSMLSQLDDAIENGEVWVAYQPKLDLASNRICGAEALARWTHPTKGPISPLEFISAAETHDRIEKLTHFVLDQAIAAAATVGARGIPFNIAVNLSARLLTDRNFPAKVSALLRRHRLDPSRLTLELTETAALDGSGEDLHSLVRLRDLGVKISIDDYGTGLSTLEYLKKIPASEIKIDQSFIRAIRDNRSDRLMVQSTIALAHSLGHSVVAEGVEDKPTLDLLGEMNCNVAQGFIIGRPTSFRALMKKVLGEQKRSAA